MSLPAGLTLYNPDLLSKSDLIAGFIARQPLLEELLDDLRRTTTDGSPQHHLLLGQRGLGKTTLLRRLAFAITDEPKLNAIWQPLIFPEEQYNVSTLDDFWLNCADSLSDALEQAGKKRQAEALDEQVAQLGQKPYPGAALDLLLTQATQINRRLVLLVDNLDIILGRIGEAEEWPFRKLLSNESRLLIIGASSRALEAFYEHNRAFYDFFQIHELKGLDEAETFSVLLRLASQSAKPEIEKLIQDQPARIQTLRQLTGGNPRTIVLLFRILAQNPDGDANLDLEQLLDLYTPLYKARFEELPDQAQKLIDLMALHWDPITAGDLSAQAGWTVNNVSAQLKRLEDLGVVEKVPWFGEKKTGFQIAERFFNIWYLMRASRRVRRKLIWLVRFLESWYSADDLRKKGEDHLQGDVSMLGNARYAELSFAYAQVTTDRLLRARLESAGLRAALADDKVREYFDFSDLPKTLLDKKDRMEAMRKLAEEVPRSRKDWAGIDPLEFWHLLAGSPYYEFPEKRRIFEDLPSLTEAQLRQLFDQLLADKKRIESHYNLLFKVVAKLYGSLASGEMADAFDWQAAEVVGGPSLAHVSISAVVNPFFGRHSPEAIAKAETVYKQMTGEVSVAAKAWNGLGNLFQHQLNRFDEAETAYRKAISLDPQDPFPWSNLGDLLQDHLNRFSESEAAYRKAIALDKDFAYPWSGLAYLFAIHFGNFDESEVAYRKSVELNPTSPIAANMLGIILRSQGRTTEALAMFLEALHREPRFLSAEINFVAALQERSANETEQQQLLDLARQAQKFLPDTSPLQWVLLQILCLQGNWHEAKQLFHSLAENLNQNVRSETISALRAAIRVGPISELLSIFEQSGASDRWRPLYEALRATEAGSIDYLRRVAPEVQSAARSIYTRLKTN